MATVEQAAPISSEQQESREKPVSTRTTPLGIPVFVYQVILGLFVLGLWQYASGRWIKELFISNPVAVAKKLVELVGSPSLLIDVQTTLIEFGVGYALGATMGIALGVVLGRSQFLADVLQPYIMALYSIPKVALTPLFIIWFGIDLNSKIAMVTLFTVFLVFVNTYAGIRNINEHYVNLARIMGASTLTIMRRVMFPSAAPEILLGLRTSLPYAMIGAVVGEFIASNRGLGYFIYRSAQLFDPAGLFSGIIILVAMVVSLTQAVLWLERKLVRWTPVVEARVAL